MKRKKGIKNKAVPYLIIFLSLCCASIIPHDLFAKPPSAPESRRASEERVTPKKKPLLPSQRLGISPDPSKALYLPPIDVQSLIKEDRDAGKGRPLRVGIHRPINASPQTHGEWYDYRGGKGSVWFFQIHVESALGIRVHFTDVNLPRGARVYVYSPSHPENYSGPHVWGPSFWAGTIGGDTVIIEMAIPMPYDPYGPGIKPPFIIKEISHMYGDPQSKSEFGIFPRASSCNNDASCYPAWALEGDAVGRILIDLGGSTAYCTGTMLHSQMTDDTPYFLTANHCIDENTDLSDVDIYWFYETSACNGPSPDMYLTPKSNNAVFYAGKNLSEFTDFTLLEILGTVPRNLTWASWTAKEPDIGDAVVGIHHPGLPTDDHRRISLGIVDTDTNNFWNILWNSGSTEIGSSGSCIWNSADQCIGQLYGGGASCSNPLGTDAYGKFSVSYPFMQNFLQSGSDDSLEDNDTRASAKSIADGAYKSNIVKFSDEDWYSINVPDNTMISVDLSFINDHGDINMELYRGTDPTPVSSSTGTADSEHVEHLNTGGAIDFFLRVFLSDDTRNNYNMTAHVGTSSSTLWAKNYGFLGGESNAIQPTSDNGYIAAGGMNGDFWAFKLDQAGDIQWQKSYDYDPDRGSFATSIQQTTDGGYIAAGDHYTSSGSDAWVLKLDANGNVQWQRTYGSSSDEDYANVIQQTPDGGFILVGATYSYGAGDGDFWLIKLASSGIIQWQKTYGGSDYEEAYSIQQTTDSGYIIAGYTDSFGAGNNDFWVLKVDTTGNIQWQKTYGSGDEQEVAHSVQQTSDGGYVVAGETYSFGGGSADFWVLRLDQNGDIQWQKSYGSADGELAYSIQQTADGRFIIAGETYSFSTYEYDALIIKLDSNGNIEWQHTYGGSDDDGIDFIKQVSGGGYIAVGYTYSFPELSWILKLPSNGNIAGCSIIGPSNATAYSTTASISNTGVTGQNSSASPLTISDSILDTTAIATNICYADILTPEIFTYPVSLDIGYVNLSGSSSRKVVVRNMGDADLIISSINISGPGASQFSRTNNCTTIPATGSCSIDVTFSPTSAGTKSAILTIFSDDPNVSTLDIPLSGTGGNILVVTESGSGNGTATSSPPGIDTGNDYIEAYAPGTNVTLTAIADAGSGFVGWTWGGCSGTGDCAVTMNADTTVTARFELCADQPVRIDGATPAYHSTLQDAYDAAADGDTIQSHAARFIGDLNINRNISIAFDSGYDCSYSTITDKTRIKGAMTISGGTVTIDNLILE